MFFRTDLAVEGEEASRTAPPEEKRNGCRITRMELRGEQAPPVPQSRRAGTLRWNCRRSAIISTGTTSFWT